MNAFGMAQLVEAKGLAVLAPFLRQATGGTLLLLNRGPLARALQETVGDGILTMRDGLAWSIELKVEERDTGNLFLESWSNRNLNSRQEHVARGSNPGWFMRIQSELLGYYFLDTDTFYLIDVLRLKRWAFLDWNIAKRFPEKPQGKREQLNDAWGWCVPAKVLMEEKVGMTKRHPRKDLEAWNALEDWNALAPRR